jgi:hypothetical protein
VCGGATGFDPVHGTSVSWHTSWHTSRVCAPPSGYHTPSKTLSFPAFGAWRSPVAHLLWEQGVPGSNPGAPT